MLMMMMKVTLQLSVIHKELEYVWSCIYREDESVTIFPPELDEWTRFQATEISNDETLLSARTIPGNLLLSFIQMLELNYTRLTRSIVIQIQYHSKDDIKKLL